MTSSHCVHFGIQLLSFLFVCVTRSQQACSPPNIPLKGAYFPKQDKFQVGEKVTYNCTSGYVLMGKDASRCKLNGGWSNPSPYCDRKAKIRNIFAMDSRGFQPPDLKLTDSNTSTCFSIKSGESIQLSLENSEYVYALRIFFKTGAINFAISALPAHCDTYKGFGSNQWVVIQCKKSTFSKSVLIQDKASVTNYTTVCEIEVYATEEEGCEAPPEVSVANGYFEITRTLAKLMCEDGYRIDKYNDRLVCEGGSWGGRTPQCNEILCNPAIHVNAPAGVEWKFIDPVEKIKIGTRKKIKCSDGYTLVGKLDTIICQMNGEWSKPNATCKEAPNKKTSTKTIIFSVVGIVVVVVILSLLVATIYYVKKQRREVVVVYKQSTEGSVMGSEAEYATTNYYESIQSTVPQPPTSSRPTVQMLNESFFAPLERHDSQKTLPSDIAFGTLKQSALYRC